MRQRRTLWGCTHGSTITTITAGLAREVCESCGHVGVSYVEPAVRLHSEVEEDAQAARDRLIDIADIDEASVFEAIVSFEGLFRPIKCGLCARQAVFTVPEGLRCEEHAWQAAAFLDWEATEPWVPIRIYGSNA